LEFTKDVTFITGENGSGKSTFIEALAINAGFNPEGGSKDFNFHTFESHSVLYEEIKLVRSAYRNKDGFFLRAESFYNVANEVDKLYLPYERHKLERNYGGHPHERSHGESFMALIDNRFGGDGLYIFDEPESALSITSQLNLMLQIKRLVEKKSQFIIATHSPILMAYPGADIYNVSDKGFELIKYEESEQYKLTKFFINNYQIMLVDLGIGNPT